jgi:hypothetical protein
MYHEHMNTGLNNQVKIRTEHAAFTRMETKNQQHGKAVSDISQTYPRKKVS